MATLEIDGIGKVEIDDGFLKLSPDQQAIEVDAIAAQIRGTAPAVADRPMTEEEQSTLAAIQGAGPRPDPLAKRGSVLPVGKTKEGETVMALPGFLEGPRQTIMDLIEGRRTADQISGKEIFDLGGLFAGSAAGGPAGTGAGIARAAAEREALASRPPALPPEAVPAAPGAAAAAPEPTPAPVAAAVPETAAPEPVIPPSATTEEFRQGAKSFYKKMEDAKVEIAPQTTRRLVDDVNAAVERVAYDKDLHPGAAAALKRINDIADQPLSFQKLDILRQIAKEAGASPKAGERKVSEVIIEKIDDLVGKLTDKDVTAGDAKAAAESIFQARHLWSKVAKLDEVANLVERARISAANFSGSGFENALRTEFRALAKNKAKMRTFTKGEQEAIKRIAKGSVGSNAARAGGKLAPTGIVSASLSSGLGASIGTALGVGPFAGAAATTGIGFTARALATKLTQRHVDQLESVIRNGGGSPSANRTLARSQAVLKALKDETVDQASGGAPPAAAAAGSTDTRQ